MLSILSTSRKKRLDGEQGFTLIELLVVVVILGILIAIAIPVYLNYRKSANDKAAQSDLRNAISVLEVCSSDGGYPTAIDADGKNMAGCGTGTTALNLSSNTSIKYTYASSTTSYIITSTNSGGGPKFYCYNSLKGGSVAQVTAGTPSLASTC